MNQSIPLTLPAARRVLMTSFYLSQGSYPLQELLFGFVHLLRPDWRLSEAMSQDLLRLVTSICALVSRPELHGPLGDAAVDSTLKSEIKAMRTELGYEPAKLDETEWKEVHCNLLARFIERDYHYLCEQTSRPRSMSMCSGAIRHPRHDPYLSLFCHHVQLGHKVGCAVFDEMLANMAALVRQYPSLTSLKRYFPLDDGDLAVEHLAAVVAVYNRWLPRSPVPISAEP